MIDIIDWCESNLDSVRPNPREIQADCPWCGKGGHLYVNAETGNYICFRCEERGRGLVGLVAEVEGISWPEARRYIFRESVEFKRRSTETPEDLLDKLDSLRAVSREDEPLVEADLPDEFKPVYDLRALRWSMPIYLKERGISRETARKYELGYADRGKYTGRLVLPFKCPNGHSFTTRDVTGAQMPRYLNPPEADNKRLLYGWENVVANDEILLVEGPFDVLKLDQHGFPAAGIFGKDITEAQVKLLSGNVVSLIVMMDPEAPDAALKVAAVLKPWIENVFVAELPDGIDPGAASIGHVSKAFYAAREFTGDRVEHSKALLRRLSKLKIGG